MLIVLHTVQYTNISSTNRIMFGYTHTNATSSSLSSPLLSTMHAITVYHILADVQPMSLSVACECDLDLQAQKIFYNISSAH